VKSGVSLYIRTVRVRRLAVAAAIVGLGALLFSGSAQACSCARVAPKEALRQADAAIVGRLVEVIPRGDLRADYRYRVQHVYKPGQGIRRGVTISVRSATSSAACGLPAQTERRYGVLLSRAEGRWTSGLCGLLSPELMRQASCAS
jgi:hypothetical protein